MQTITIAANKGGTGKTTTAAALAQAAAAAGKKVLAIDLDPQSNLTFILNGDPDAPGSYQLLNLPKDAPEAEIRKTIQRTPQGLNLIAASSDLSTEKTGPGSGKRLARALDPIKKSYDIIIIDTPPQAGELTYNALIASTGAIIPLESDKSSIDGLYFITDIIHYLQEQAPDLRILGSLITRYDPRPKLNRYLRDRIAEAGQEVGAPLLMEIRSGIAIREAQALQENLYTYAPKSKPAQDYMSLYKLITKPGRKGGKR